MKAIPLMMAVAMMACAARTPEPVATPVEVPAADESCAAAWARGEGCKRFSPPVERTPELVIGPLDGPPALSQAEEERRARVIANVVAAERKAGRRRTPEEQRVIDIATAKRIKRECYWGWIPRQCHQVALLRTYSAWEVGEAPVVTECEDAYRAFRCSDPDFAWTASVWDPERVTRVLASPVAAP